MSSNELVEQIMARVIAVWQRRNNNRPSTGQLAYTRRLWQKKLQFNEFVGTAIGDTTGTVIASVDTTTAGRDEA